MPGFGNQQQPASMPSVDVMASAIKGQMQQEGLIAPKPYNILENPVGNNMLDHLERVYKLRQDVERCDDLESEEKAMVNLYAQEYDAMKILSTIPKDTDLY